MKITRATVFAFTDNLRILWWGYEDGTTAYVISGKYGMEKSENLK